MSWVCEEKLAAVALGCVGLATLDPEKVVGGAVAATGLMRLWGAAREQDGVGSDALLARVRKRVGKGFKQWTAGNPGAEADIRAADNAMAQHLAECVPPVAELAKTTYDDEDFPAYAARLIVDRLAARNPIFSETSDIRVPAAREFALAVVTGALTEAKSVEPFMLRLTQEVVLLIPQHLQRIERTVEAGFASQDAQFAELKAMLSSQLGIPIEVLGREITAILELNPATSQAELYDDLRDYKRKHDALAAQLDAVLVADNRIAALKADAEAALAAYDHDAADRIFGEMRAVEDERIAAGMRRSAEYAVGQAQARMLKRDWQGAAEVWMDAGHKLALFDAEAGGDLLNAAGKALTDFGEKFAGGAMEAAIAAYRAALEFRTYNDLPAAWAATQNNLAAALGVLGDRSAGEAGIARLAEAVTAFRAALKVYARDEFRANWATTQGNLGTALRLQGERCGEVEGDALFAEAATAYRAVLEVCDQEILPAQWARAKNNLGALYLSQCKRQLGVAGFDLVTEALAAFRAALEVCTRNDLRELWAESQVHLGNALKAQGELLGWTAGIAPQGDAVAAYRAALEVYTRDAHPANWAMTQNNLGIALQVQGQHQGGASGVALLGEAVEAYRAALEEQTRDAMPAQWAAAQTNLAIAFEALSQLEIGLRCKHLTEARSAVIAALAVFTPKHMPFHHGNATNLLARIDAALAEHCLDASAPS
ncbi:MAG: tetratricopeptide repeat protein [Erythrobacter sp.]|uniref:tetratricopeptide repeat protein n=1 Tax=Erythrobacter sp. TaxID=1042 RepID=UPI0025E07A82|nr:tetratricopeptide repeat protein [Erythrobacter sp.]MCL9998892.1 tetratricopeptide repeat protein [Erythrobacter sp.]